MEQLFLLGSNLGVISSFLLALTAFDLKVGELRSKKSFFELRFLRALYNAIILQVLLLFNYLNKKKLDGFLMNSNDC